MKNRYRYFAGIWRYSGAGILPRLRKVTKFTPERFDLRLPTDLRVRLGELAKKERRSLNGQAVHCLEEYLKAPSLDDLMQAIGELKEEVRALKEQLGSKQ